MTQLQDLVSVIQEFTANYGDTASVGGLGLSIAQWFQSIVASRKRARKERERETIDHYLEWLRRQEHTALLKRVNESNVTLQAISDLISALWDASDNQRENILDQLRQSDTIVQKKLDKLTSGVQELQLRVRSHKQVHTEFEVEYRKHVERKYGRIRLIGVKEMRDIKQALSIAYVSLRLLDKRANDAELEARPADEVLAAEHLLAIRGPAGSGKTTLLSWIALQCTDWDGDIAHFSTNCGLPGLIES